MAEPGWYDDPGSPALLRWWDGTRWTDSTTWKPGATPPTSSAPPPMRARVRADGSIRGPSLRASLVPLLLGLAGLVASMALLIPAFIDQLSGERLAIPGRHTVELDAGEWVLYERTGTSRGTGGFTFDVDEGVSVRPESVIVDGPAPVLPYADFGVVETIDVGSRSYTAAVYFDIAVAGTYEIAVSDARPGEVIVGRPVTALFSYWPWFVVAVLSTLAVIAGVVMWIIGAANRRAAARAGGGPARYN